MKFLSLFFLVCITTHLSNAQSKWSDKIKISRKTAEVGVADVDRDGHVDIVICGKDQYWYAGPSFEESYLLGTSNGGPYAARVADINGDGWPDFVTSDGARNEGDLPGHIYLYINPADKNEVKTAWKRIIIYSGNVRHQNDMRIIDMDGDGLLDIIERTWSSERVVIAFQNEDIEQWTVRPFDTGEKGKPEGISAGDVDGDGEMEMVLSGVYWDNPDGWRQGQPEEYLIDEQFVQEEVKSAVGDIDLDGDNDIYMASAERDYVYLAWYENTGKNEDGGINFKRHMIKDNFGNCHMVELVDMDHDGDLDISTAQNFGDSGCLIFYNEHKGASWKEVNIDPTGSFYTGIAKDLDKDGDIDLVGPDKFYGFVHYYLNENDKSPPTPEEPKGIQFINVMLEGYYLAEQQEMGIGLNSQGLLPTTQPFNETPWEYDGKETLASIPEDMVDWMLVCLRDQDGNILEKKACVLLKNGDLQSVEGEKELIFDRLNEDIPVLGDESLYLSIHHKSHLGIVCAVPEDRVVDIVANDDLFGQHQLKLVDNQKLIYCGDFDSNHIINNQDYNSWKVSRATINQYLSIDADGNGIINNLDYNLWSKNRSKIGNQLLK